MMRIIALIIVLAISMSNMAAADVNLSTMTKEELVSLHNEVRSMLKLMSTPIDDILYEDENVVIELTGIEFDTQGRYEKEIDLSLTLTNKSNTTMYVDAEEISINSYMVTSPWTGSIGCISPSKILVDRLFIGEGIPKTVIDEELKIIEFRFEVSMYKEGVSSPEKHYFTRYVSVVL